MKKNRFNLKVSEYNPYIPHGVEKRLLDQRLEKHKEFNKYMKVRLNQIEYQTNKV